MRGGDGGGVGMSPYLNTKQAADYCNVSVTTFRQHVSKRIPKRMVGSKPLYAKEDLDQYMTVVIVDETARRRASRRRGSAHASTKVDPKVKRLAADLEGGGRGR